MQTARFGNALLSRFSSRRKAFSSQSCFSLSPSYGATSSKRTGMFHPQGVTIRASSA